MTKARPTARRMHATHPRVETLRVKDVMSPHLVTVPADEPVLGAAARMSRAGVRHLPVVDHDGRCLGVVDLPAVALSWPAGPDVHGRLVVRALLSGRRTPLLRADHPLHLAARAMTSTGMDALPVVDDDGRLTGLVTAWDVVRAVAGRVTHPGSVDVPEQQPAWLLSGSEVAWAWVSLP